MSPGEAPAPPAPAREPCCILSLDGGGAKGFYTLGILKELEGLLGSPLSDKFQIIFGTSTGAIIAALLAMGETVDTIHGLYRKYVPSIMGPLLPSAKSAALRRLATEVFGEKKFDAFKTGVGIVATNWDNDKPCIFKASKAQAHGSKGTFLPGFGCTIADAVVASCSAVPFFRRQSVTTSEGSILDLADGGYCANNPTLYAIADGVMALKRPREDLRVVSLGVGHYPQPKYALHWRLLRRIPSVQMWQKTLNVNTTSMDQLRFVLFKDVPTVRISEAYPTPEMATDLMESNLVKLDLLFRRGRESFGKFEPQLKELLGLKDQ